MPIIPVTKHSVFNIFRKDLQCIRYDKGNYVNGLWVDGQTVNFTIKASVQGVNNEVLETLPEGYRTRMAYTLYTSSKLQTSIVGESEPDIVIIEGDKYQVIKITSNQNLKGYATEHYEVIVVKVNEDTP